MRPSERKGRSTPVGDSNEFLSIWSPHTEFQKYERDAPEAARQSDGVLRLHVNRDELKAEAPPPRIGSVFNIIFSIIFMIAIMFPPPAN